MNIRTGRVEAFSDCVISILITIMVFDIKFPELHHDFTHRDVVAGLGIVGPKLIAYLFSFLVVGILWLNHHHLFHLIQVVDEKLLWLNLHLLFWMSLIPFPTSMLGKNPFLPESAAIYGGILFMASLSFSLMRRYVDRHNLMDQHDRQLNKEITKVTRKVRVKNYIGALSYLLSVPLAYVSVFISFGLYLIPTVLFFIPDGVEAAGEEIEEVEEKSST